MTKNIEQLFEEFETTAVTNIRQLGNTETHIAESYITGKTYHINPDHYKIACHIKKIYVKKDTK